MERENERDFFFFAYDDIIQYMFMGVVWMK